MNYSLNGAEVLKICGDGRDGKISIMTYPDIVDCDTIADLFKKARSDCILLLFESRQNFGHWTSIIQHRNSRGDVCGYETFDSYGIFPDDELKFAPYMFRMMNSMMIPHLTCLLYNTPSNIKLEYNKVKLQKMEDDINTCGRWAGMRIRLRHIPLDDFNAIIAKICSSFKISPDELITLATLSEATNN